MTWTVTLKELRDNEACKEVYNKVVRMLQKKSFTDADHARKTYIKFRHVEPIGMLDILESNGLDDALWATRCLTGHDRDLRLYAVWCARQAEQYTTDPRVKACNDVTERFANGLATAEELSAACAAWYAACAARDAARAAAGAAQKEMFISMLNGTAPWQDQPCEP